MFSLGNCTTKGTYNIFGSNQPQRHVSDITMQSIVDEKCWEAIEDDDDLLKKLKANIDECNRADFETEAEYQIELKRRLFMYSSTKEILNIRAERQKRNHNYIA